MSHPNGLWIYLLSDIRKDYMAQLKARQVGRVYLKVADGHQFWADQCSANLIGEFHAIGSEVYGWGYHYGTPDVDDQVSAVKQALACGLDGYVVDVEKEVENPARHDDVGRFLDSLRPIMTGKPLGFTSFAFPSDHPAVPWQTLVEKCDLFMPQIYFEKWTPNSKWDEYVSQSIDEHKKISQKVTAENLLPIWCQEPPETADGRNASVSQLQDYFQQYQGSSLWRAPDRAWSQQAAWALDYRGNVGLSSVNSNKSALDGMVKRVVKLYGHDKTISLTNTDATIQRLDHLNMEIDYEGRVVDVDLQPAGFAVRRDNLSCQMTSFIASIEYLATSTAITPVVKSIDSNKGAAVYAAARAMSGKPYESEGCAHAVSDAIVAAGFERWLDEFLRGNNQRTANPGSRIWCPNYNNIGQLIHTVSDLQAGDLVIYNWSGHAPSLPEAITKTAGYGWDHIGVASGGGAAINVSSANDHKFVAVPIPKLDFQVGFRL